MELDAFSLPDTQGVSYGVEHVKTSVAVNSIDAGARRLWPALWPGRDGRPARLRFYPAKAPLPQPAHKQSQFPPDQKEGQVLGGKRVMVNGTIPGLGQNQANSCAGRWPDRAAGRGTLRGFCC